MRTKKNEPFRREGRPLSKSQIARQEIAAHQDEIVGAGQEAWTRRKAAVRSSWEDWKLVGQAISLGATEASNWGKGRRGAQYARRFSEWLDKYGFDDMDKDDRAKLLWLVERLKAVEELRDGWTESERANWNHPSTIYRIARCKDRGLEEFRKTETAEDSPDEDDDYEDEADEDEADEDDKYDSGKWKRNLIILANKIVGAAGDLDDDPSLADSVDPAVIKTLAAGAEAFAKIVECLTAAEAPAKRAA